MATEAESTTIAPLLQRYGDEVTTTKKSVRRQRVAGPFALMSALTTGSGALTSSWRCGFAWRVARRFVRTEPFEPRPFSSCAETEKQFQRESDLGGRTRVAEMRGPPKVAAIAACNSSTDFAIFSFFTPSVSSPRTSSFHSKSATLTVASTATPIARKSRV